MATKEQLEERIQELLELANMEYPNNPSWYNKLCVEEYIRNCEPEMIPEECLPAADSVHDEINEKVISVKE